MAPPPPWASRSAATRLSVSEPAKEKGGKKGITGRKKGGPLISLLQLINISDPLSGPFIGCPSSWIIFRRRAMGITAFKTQPTSPMVRAFLGRTIGKAGKAPKYVVCDRGKQFDCQGFRDWCRRKGIKRPRYGAIGRHGSIAVVERHILTLKTLLSCLLLVPYRHESFQRELTAIADWHNAFRPHTWLGGKTPDEVYYDRYPANRSPRFEPRAHWPRARRVPDLGHWYGAGPASGWNLKSPTTPDTSTCPSSPFSTGLKQHN